MTDPRELQPSDHISIDIEAVSDDTFRVSDAEVEDIGLTETFAVTLVTDDKRVFSLTGATQSETANFSYTQGEFETTIEWDAITLE